MCSFVSICVFSTIWLRSWILFGLLYCTTSAYSLLDTEITILSQLAMASGSSGSGHPESGPSTSSRLGETSALYEDVLEDDGPTLDRHLYTEEVLKMWNLAKIIQKLGTNEQCVAFAEENGLVQTQKLCRTHRTPMKVAKSTNRSFGSWCCTKGSCKSKSKIPRNNGTFFENIKIDLVHVFYLFYAYSRKWSYNDTINEDPYKETYERCLGRVTINDWYNYCRETIVAYQVDKNEAIGKIGGPGKIVQIDESKFGKRKYNRASGALAAGTIASPWSAAAGAPDTNGSGGADAKHLDVGDASDDEKDMSAADAEGVWSPDIEQSFQEALAIYPPCGRRKIILSDEGKMYGRNELIARYIKLRTGKTRTRKQVSSHIQVLARRKLREIQAKLKVDGGVMKEKAMQSVSTLSSAQIVAGFPHHPHPHPAYHTQFWQPGLQAGTSQDVKPFPGTGYKGVPVGGVGVPGSDVAPPPPWEGRAIATHKLRLVEFSAFVEHPRDPDTYPPSAAPAQHLFVHIGGTVTYADPLLESVDVQQINDKFPEKKGGLKELYEKGPRNAFFLVKFWADLNTTDLDDPAAFYGVTSVYESNENMTITCSTKVCSFGKQVVEKVETEYARFEGGRFVYRLTRSPMCEYMVNFIHKLKHLPEKYMMNSVLENFTILQVVSNRDTQETLLCAAFVFEVSNSEHGAQHHIYRLVKD